MLYVSIYNGIDMKTETTQHRRFSIHPGTPNVYDIMRSEALGDHEQGPTSTQGKLPVIKEDTRTAAWPLKTTMRPTGPAYTARTGRGRDGEAGAGRDETRRTLVLGSFAAPYWWSALLLT